MELLRIAMAATMKNVTRIGRLRNTQVMTKQVIICAQAIA